MKILRGILIILLCLSSNFSTAAEKQAVVAIVNDEAITDLDVKKRARFVIKSSGMSNDKRTRDLVREKVIQMLVDEKLFSQEAKRLEVEVDDAEMNFALNSIAAKNKIKRRELDAYLKAQGIDKTVLENQIHHQLLWNKVVRTRIQPRVAVTDKEVEENKTSIVEQIKAQKAAEKKQETEVKLAEIVMYFEREGDNKKQEVLAKQLASEIRGGADFAELAKKFSQNSGASQGGEIGWLYPSQLSSKIGKVVSKLKSGSISDPIIMDDGVHILKVLARKAPKPMHKAEELINTAQVRDIMFNTKLNLQVKGYIRKLRREAFVDIK